MLSVLSRFLGDVMFSIVYRIRVYESRMRDEFRFRERRMEIRLIKLLIWVFE